MCNLLCLLLALLGGRSDPGTSTCLGDDDGRASVRAGWFSDRRPSRWTFDDMFSRFRCPGIRSTNQRHVLAWQAPRRSPRSTSSPLQGIRLFHSRQVNGKRQKDVLPARSSFQPPARAGKSCASRATRYWGNPTLVAFIDRLARERQEDWLARHPGRRHVQPRGGPMLLAIPVIAVELMSIYGFFQHGIMTSPGGTRVQFSAKHGGGGSARC